MKKLLLIALLASQPVLADTIHLAAYARYASCLKGQQCYLSGYHDIEIINESGTDHQYNYMYGICTDTGACHDESRAVTVAAHDRFNGHYENHISTIFGYARTYQLTATTLLQGAYNAHSTGNNFIIVN